MGLKYVWKRKYDIVRNCIHKKWFLDVFPDSLVICVFFKDLLRVSLRFFLFYCGHLLWVLDGTVGMN